MRSATCRLRGPTTIDRAIIIRVTAEQKELLRAAAAKGGFGLSGWILSQALKAAGV